MKFLPLLFILSFSLSKASAAPEIICSLSKSKKVLTIAKEHSRNDKNRHCSVSCMLATQCNDHEVMFLGLLKEIKDFLGPGEASEADLQADAFGINLVRSQVARNYQECLSQCDLYYP